MATAAFRRHVVERRDQDLRRKEFEREDLVSKLNSDAVFRSNLDSDDRVDGKRRLRIQRIREEEQKTYEQLMEAAHKRAHREITREREEKDKQESERLETQRIRDEKLRQAIRENSVELRELEKKLNYAYMNKERSLQVQEKALQDQISKAREAELIAEMNERLEKQKQLELERDHQEYLKSLDYSKALNDQLLEQEARKEAEFEQFLKEKEMVDQIVRKILDEDAREAERRLEKQAETKQFIEKFIVEREQWRREESARQEAENRKIEAYARDQAARAQAQQDVKKHRDEERTVIYDRLAAEMDQREKAKAELEQLRIDLYEEEQEEESRRRDQERLQNRIRKRLELIDAYRNQMLEKRFRAIQEQEEEDVVRRKMMDRYAEEEKLEQLNAQKRRMKQMEHRRAVDAILAERRLLLQKEREIAEMELAREKEIDDYRQQVVEQERQRLLREHAVKLLGHLPKGVLRDQKDLDLFDEEFRRKFGNIKLDDPRDA
ncbi:tumor suppressor, Mitostatin-domain-containing protein [Fimicolochytrium jonesii]|uniref:tumor suppressor, Mitostatin-domain-containing protein n=1 Tax=Fimicolochytrium jonesii TaxID=1396493 RepID=UPI0022FE84A0|nr:tumor suppressor, Mitostatin-domain-containing protein [Fimicolochytrium jonesii]KAI8817754.1 tumor suppressor, Mitostatin-domain-containing protein [Fimicolochytrium jonesii]